jgi:hypothetical protein
VWARMAQDTIPTTPAAWAYPGTSSASSPLQAQKPAVAAIQGYMISCLIAPTPVVACVNNEKSVLIPEDTTARGQPIDGHFPPTPSSACP